MEPSSSSTALPTASFLVIKGNDQGTRFDFSEASFFIGRSAECPVRLLDSEVSRRHAQIHRTAAQRKTQQKTQCKTQWEIEDLGSSNGTFVNGKQIRKTVLQSGDHIEIGCSELVFSQQKENAEGYDESSLVNFLMQEDSQQQSQIVSEVRENENEPPSVSMLRTSKGASSQSQALKNLGLLYEISEEVVQPSISQQELLQHILDRSVKALEADRGCVLLSDSGTSKMEPRVLSYKSAELAKQQMPIPRSIVDYVFSSGQGVQTTDAQHDNRFKKGQSILQAGVREALCVPIPGRASLLGVIYIDITTSSQDQILQSSQSQGRFDEEQLRLLVSIGRQAAMVVENRRYQESLVKAERLAAVGQTVAALSHHIKNILQGIHGGSYLVNQGLKGEDVELIQQGWGIVEKNQKRILSVVEDMLTFSKERTPELSLCNLNDVVGEVYELMQSRANELGVAIDYTSDSTILESIFDSDGIHRAILNVVTNGIEAALESISGKPKLHLRTEYDASQGFLKVTVADNGLGIPQEQLERIFNLFESTKGSHGTGLGLAVSQKILREHDGEILVHSEVNSGTTFELRWPFIAPAGVPAIDSATLS